ncbi:hypothetical protein VdG1_01170 [Verticillium dahliae VDG1]|nr:hypothetical protein VdG1_01170 [Verticillium dahliae VDG1]
MSYTLYDGSVTHALAAVRACQALILKAEAHATATSTPIDQLLDARLAPDMLPLTFQEGVAIGKMDYLTPFIGRYLA